MSELVTLSDYYLQDVPKGTLFLPSDPIFDSETKVEPGVFINRYIINEPLLIKAVLSISSDSIPTLADLVQVELYITISYFVGNFSFACYIFVSTSGFGICWRGEVNQFSDAAPQSCE